MNRLEIIKSLNSAEMAKFLENIIAIAIGTRDFVDYKRREEWLNEEDTLNK